MKVLIACFLLSAGLFSFTMDSSTDVTPERVTFDDANVVSTEVLNAIELGKISSSLNTTEVIEAKVHTMKDGGTFLEYTTSEEGVASTYRTQGYGANFVPPCHCGPGADGIYNAWWEGLTPYRYKQPYCLPCGVVSDDEVEGN